MKLLSLLVLLFSVSSSFGQLWKNYADSAKIFQSQKKEEAALEFYIKANTILREDSFWTQNHGRMANTIAGIYWRMGRFDQAAVFSEEAIKVAERTLTSNHPFYATSCHNLGMIYSALGDFDKAEKFYLSAKKIRENIFGKDNRDYAITCNTLGLLYMDIGQFNLSEQYFLEAQRANAASAGKDSREYAFCSMNLATLYRKLGQFEKSEPLFLLTKVIWEQRNELDREYAGLLINLANLYADIAKYDKAEQLLLRARDLLQSTGGSNHPDFASLNQSLGFLYMLRGRYLDSENSFLEARRIIESSNGKYHPDYANLNQALASLCSEVGRFGDAEKYLLEAREIVERTTGINHVSYGYICYDLGNLHQRMGQAVKAMNFLEEAKKIFEFTFSPDHPDCIAVYTSMANLCAGNEEPDRAIRLYDTALNAQKNLLERVFLVTSDKERLSYLNQTRLITDAIFSICISRSGYADGRHFFDLALSWRNILLNYARQMRQAVYNTPDTAVIDKYNEWINLREKIAFIYSLPVAKRPADLVLLEERADTYEKEMVRSLSGRQSMTRTLPLTSIEVSNKLETGEAALEFVSFQYFNGNRWTDSTYYIALLTTRDKPEPDVIRLFEQRQLDMLIRTNSSGAGEHQINYIYSGGKMESGAATLFDLIWKPITGKLSGVHTIYFAPSGSLHKVAFSGLVSESGELVSDKYRLVQLNSTASVADRRDYTVSGSDRMVFFGGIQYDADSSSMASVAKKDDPHDWASRSLPDDLSRDAFPEFRYLEGTEKEITTIELLGSKKKFRVTNFRGLEATEEAYKSLNGTNAPAVLHIATHGFFFPDPKKNKKDNLLGGTVFRQSDDPLFRSGLALAGANNAWKGKPVNGVEDGILTAFEVSNIYLPDTKLAVLSACETGLGDINGSEGVYGLQRAFKIAGVDHLVMSLWKVPDSETSEFMLEFYKNLFSKETIEMAFHNAQMVMKNKYRKKPYKWAAWVLIR